MLPLGCILKESHVEVGIETDQWQVANELDKIRERSFQRLPFVVNHILRNAVYQRNPLGDALHGLYENLKRVVEIRVTINPNSTDFNDFVPCRIKAGSL